MLELYAGLKYIASLVVLCLGGSIFIVCLIYLIYEYLRNKRRQRHG